MHGICRDQHCQSACIIVAISRIDVNEKQSEISGFPFEVCNPVSQDIMLIPSVSHDC